MTESDNEALLPSRAVKHRYGGICDMTLWRWGRDPDLGFPAPIVINRRKYWRASDLDHWDSQHSLEASAAVGRPARSEAPDALVSGLYVVTQPGGTQSYAYRYRFDGRPAKYTIGAADDDRQRAGHIPVVSLREARLIAQALNSVLRRARSIRSGADVGDDTTPSS